MDMNKLKEFLTEAQMPHAKGTSNAKRLEDGSVLITYQDGEWEFRDEFYGGEPYGGREVIHFRGKPLWIMVYYGRVHDTDLSADDVYGFLRTALQYPPSDLPLRGPASFQKDNLEYQNFITGGIEQYDGEEIILENGKQIYWARYIGGLVDQRANTGF